MMARSAPWKVLLLLVVLRSLTACVPPAPRLPTVDEQSRSARLIDQGVLLLRQGRAEEARASFEVAFDLTGDIAALDGLGCAALLEGDSEGALRYFGQVVDQAPDYAPVYANLAFLYEAAGRVEEAKILYDRALALDPGNFRVRNNHAALLYDQHGRASGGALGAEARSELLRALSIARHPKVYANLETVSANEDEDEEE